MDALKKSSKGACGFEVYSEKKKKWCSLENAMCSRKNPRIWIAIKCKYIYAQALPSSAFESFE